MKRKKIIRYIGIALIAAGIIVLIYPLYTNFVMKRREVEILNSWENQIKVNTSQPAETATGEGGIQTIEETGATGQTETTQQAVEETARSKTYPVASSKTPLFKISIPKIKSEWLVYEGSDIPTLKSGPGHYIGTAMPGQPGTCVIAGHRTTYGAPFNRINELINGDKIIFEVIEGEELKQYTYLVTGMIEVIPTDLSPIKYTEYPSLVLTSCTPKFYATRRLLVFANLATE